jgi:hypothetical protein
MLRENMSGIVDGQSVRQNTLAIDQDQGCGDAKSGRAIVDAGA